MENALTFDQLPQAVNQLYTKVENIEKLLLQKEAPTLETDQLLTIKQAGEFLHLAVPTLYGLVHTSSIPVNKRGKRLYFSKTDLTAWIKSGRKKTISEIQAEVKNHSAKKKIK